MKKYIGRILSFILVLGIIRATIGLVQPEYYGNPGYWTKFEYYRDNSGVFNAAAFGSSRIYRQFDPSSVSLSVENKRISFFNFGSPSTFNPEVISLYRRFLGTIEEGDINAGSSRSFYWIRFNDIIGLTSHFMKNPAWNNLLGESGLISFYKAYIHKLADFGIHRSGKTEDASVLGHFTDGYYSLDQQLSDEPETGFLINRMNDLLENPSILGSYRRCAKEAESITFPSDGFPAPGANQYYELYLESKAKGVDLYFVIPPRLGSYEGIIEIAKDLPPENVINLADPNKFPEFYELDYSFDTGHLNSAGADLFSRAVAAEIQRNHTR